MRDVRLYSQSVNPFSEKVAGGLAVKGLAYKREVSDDPADVARWSPVTHRLPVLEVDGTRRADSSAILAWLDELEPEPPLLAPDPKTAAAQQRLATWADSSFLWYYDRWRAARYPRPGDELPPAAGLLERLRNHVDRTFARSASPTRLELRELEVVQEMGNRLDDLVGFLGDRPFFHAERPSVADLSVYGMLKVMREGPMSGTAEMIHERPALDAYMKRMDEIARPR